jgi:solute:Na+ symporter, SSS family
MATIDYVLVILFFIGLISMGFYFHRWVGEADDHFLAGRHLPPFILAAVVAASNISLYNYIGYTGIAYKSGISIIWQEWTGLMAMVTVGLFIHPILWRLQVRSVPEFLEVRFNKFVRSLVAFITVLRGGFWLGIVLYLSVTVSIGVTGIDNRTLWVVVFSIITVFVIMFTALGGAWSVALTDVAQFALLLLGTLIIIPIVMPLVGWYPGLKTLLPAETFDFMPHAGAYNWAFVFAIWLLGIQYCSTNNDLVVRALAASSPRASALGWVLAGAVMIPYAFLIVLLGLVSTHVVPGLTGSGVDMAVPLLLHKYMPSGLLGIVLCGFMASQMSTVTGSLNANSVVVSNDIYYSLFNRKATNRQLLLTARLATVGVGIIMIAYSYLVPYIGSAVEAYLVIVGVTDMPSFVVFIICGLFIRRVNSRGAIIGYVGGILCGALTLLLHWRITGVPFADSTIVSTASTLVITVAVSLLTPPEPPEKLERTFSAFCESAEEKEQGNYFRIWPMSRAGKFWMIVHLIGQGLFLVGVFMAAFEAAQPWAAGTATAGMGVFLVGALLRLLYR